MILDSYAIDFFLYLSLDQILGFFGPHFMAERPFLGPSDP